MIQVFFQADILNRNIIFLILEKLLLRQIIGLKRTFALKMKMDFFTNIQFHRLNIRHYFTGVYIF